MRDIVIDLQVAGRLARAEWGISLLYSALLRGFDPENAIACN
ncbi:hypothetical protein [Nostoc sp.]